uniref:DDE_Tnp_1_7 domain-containing protein n=1 Tax=Haemonchus placei TaxID=6290 RepID=A0A0N4WU61_HAEPC
MMDDFAGHYGFSDDSFGEEDETLLNEDSVQPLVVPVQYDSSEDDEHEDDCEEDDEQSWDEDVIPYDRFVFAEESGPDDSAQNCTRPIDCYQLFLTSELLDLMVTETNRYAKEKMVVRNKDLTDTTVEEMKRFLGICLYMGIVELPSMRDYWSTKPIFGCSVATKIMARNRFEVLLSCLHFVDNENADKESRLYKIQPVLDLLNTSFQRMYKPEKEICIDETMVPFKGRIVFKQFNKSKSHKYGVKLFRLCFKGAYTLKVKVYAGKDSIRTGSVADAVVMELMKGYLDQGRDLCTDSWYTSLSLANSLLARKTNLIGIIRKCRKGIPLAVKNRPLKKGDIHFQQNNEGFCFWRDKREIYMPSTRHDGSCGVNEKPKVVDDYNKMKGFVDHSDQMASYTPFVRKTAKWYIRLFFHLLTQTALVNAWMLYNQNSRMKFNDFKIAVAEILMDLDGKNSTGHGKKRKLIEIPEADSNGRRKCKSCYSKMVNDFKRQYARVHAKKVKTQCSICHGFYCLQCFQDVHKSCGST